MDQKESYALEADKLTRQKREAVKQKLSLICGKEDDINEILNSLEAYCLIILNTIK
jgi:hypothetical protein